MKLRRDTGTCSDALTAFPSVPSCGGAKPSTYGRDGSHRTP